MTRRYIRSQNDRDNHKVTYKRAEGTDNNITQLKRSAEGAKVDDR